MNKNSKNSNQLNNDNEEQQQTPKLNKKLMKLAEKEEKNVQQANQNEQQMYNMMESLMAKKMQEFEEKRQKEREEWEQKLKEKDDQIKKQMEEQQKKLDDMKKEMEEQMKKKYKKKEKLPVSNLDGFMTWEEVQKEQNVIWRFYFEDNPINWYLSGYVNKLKWRDFAAETNESITRVVVRARDHSNSGKFPKWTFLFTRDELKWDEQLNINESFPGFDGLISPAIGPFIAKEDMFQRQMRDPEFFKKQQQLVSQYAHQLNVRMSYDFLPVQLNVENALCMKLLGYDKKEEINKIIPQILNLEFFQNQEFGKKRKQRNSIKSQISIDKEEDINTDLIDKVMKKMELAQKQIEEQQQIDQSIDEDQKMSEEESVVVEVNKDQLEEKK